MATIWTRSRKLAATQAAINSRTGRGTGAAGAAPAAPATQATTAPAYQWMSTRMANIALIAAAVVVFFVGGLQHLDGSNPNPATIGSWGRNHWFWLLILWGIIAALIALNTCGTTAKTLQWVLAGAGAAVLVVFPLWGLVTSPAAPAHATTDAAQQPPQKRMLTIPAYGESPHIIAPDDSMAVVFTGSGFVVVCVYPDGTEDTGTPSHSCKSGVAKYQYVRNTSWHANSVIYEFVHIR